MMLLQLLPEALDLDSEAVAVFLDFYKAYDTVNRQFLYDVMSALGVGAGFIRWVKLLLTSTGACALVNAMCPASMNTQLGKAGLPIVTTVVSVHCSGCAVFS